MQRDVASRTAAEEAAAKRARRALLLASTLSSVGFGLVFPLLPLYMQQLSAGTATALWSGLAIAVTPLGSGIAGPFWGRLADRYGYRPMLLRALVCTTLVIGLMAAPNAAWQLVLLRALAGALGSFQPAAMAALISLSKPEDSSRAVSHQQMAQVLGSIVGPLLGGTVGAFFGVRIAAVAGAAVLVIGTALVARWFYEPPRTRVRAKAGVKGFRPTLVWLPMLTLMAAYFTDGSFNPILPLLLTQGGDGAAVAALSGIAVSLGAAAGVGGAALVGSLKAVPGPRTMAACGGILAALALAAAAAPLPWGVIGLRVACGGLAISMGVVAYSRGGLAAPPQQRGSAYGWLSSSTQMGYAASPVVAGALAAVDLRAVLMLDALLCAVMASGWGWSRWGVAAPAPTVAPRTAAEPSQAPKPSTPAS